MLNSHVEAAFCWGITRLRTAAAVLVVLLTLSGTATAVPLLQTDLTWKVTSSNPGGTDWNTDAGFDDTLWESATVLYDVGAVIPDPAFDGTKGIWDSSGQYSYVTELWIRKSFSIADPLSSASLIVGCDDDCTVWVNGVQVINDTNGFANNNGVGDLLPYLNTGTNLIAYTMADNYPVWGYNHSTWLQLDGEVQSTAVPEPGTLVLVGLGLSGLVIARRRKH